MKEVAYFIALASRLFGGVGRDGASPGRRGIFCDLGLSRGVGGR